MEEKYNRLFNLLVNKPWAITPEGLETMRTIVEARIAGEINDNVIDNSRQSAGVTMIEDVAIVPVFGPIVQKASLFSNVSGLTSTYQIRANLREAVDSGAGSIILNIDSPGGEVQGIDEVAKNVKSISRDSSIPIVAFTDSMMASAAFHIGSQADEIVATEDAMVGSIGVIAEIVDPSRAQKNRGLDVTVLRTGPQKAPGIGPISENQINLIKDMQQKFFSRFVEAVESGRNIKLSEKALDGRTFLAEDALQEGLIDRVGSFDSVVDQLVASNERRRFRA